MPPKPDLVSGPQHPHPGPFDPHGSVRSIEADGRVTITDAQGNKAVVTEGAGGTTYMYPSGGYLHISPDGTQTLVGPDHVVVGSTHASPHDPEGSTRTIGADGTVTLTDAAGRTAVVTEDASGIRYTYPSGGSVHFAPDGTETLTDPQGHSAKVTHGDDGTTTYTYPSGGSRSFGPEGTETLTAPDGGQIIHAPDGAVTVKTPDGHSSTDQTITAQDGSRVTFMTNERGENTVVTVKPDHTTIVQTPDGDTFTMNPDGSYMRTHADGTGYKESTDQNGSTTTTFFDATGKVVSDITVDPDGGSVAHNADGSIKVTNPDGTSSISETIVMEDGTKVTFMTDERNRPTVVTEKPDHTIIIQTPDGSMLTKNPDGSYMRTNPDGTGYTVSTDGGLTTKLYFDKDGNRLLDVDRSPFAEFHPLIVSEGLNSSDFAGPFVGGTGDMPSEILPLPDSLPQDDIQRGDGHTGDTVVQDPSAYSAPVDYGNTSPAGDYGTAESSTGSGLFNGPEDQIVPDVSSSVHDALPAGPTDIQTDSSVVYAVDHADTSPATTNVDASTSDGLAQFNTPDNQVVADPSNAGPDTWGGSTGDGHGPSVSDPSNSTDSSVVVDPGQVVDDSVIVDPGHQQPAEEQVDINQAAPPAAATGPEAHSDYGA